MKQINISPEVAIREAEALAEFWRNRALGHSQMAYMQQAKIQELEDLISPDDNEGVPVVKSEVIDNGN